MVAGRASPRSALGSLTDLRDHRAFLIALALGAAVRVAVVVAFPPGFVFSDGPTYLGLVDDLYPRTDRTVGYGFLLEALTAVSRDVWLVTAVQHLLGLLTAVLLYALLRRWSVPGPVWRRWPACRCCSTRCSWRWSTRRSATCCSTCWSWPAIAALAWHRRPAACRGRARRAAARAGRVRARGRPAARGRRGALLPVGRDDLARAVLHLGGGRAVVRGAGAAYAAWYHAEHGVWALTESGGRALYMRTTGFVDCRRSRCRTTSGRCARRSRSGARLDPTEYGWHTPDGTHGLVLPPGVTYDQAMGDFARRAIRAQPGDYVRHRRARPDARASGAADRPLRVRHGLEVAARTPTSTSSTTARSRAAYAAHGGDQLEARQPLADWLAWYGWTVYAWGPLLFLLTLLALLGLRGGRS